MRFHVTIFLLLNMLSVTAQHQGQALIDSMLAALPTTANDTVKARILNRVSNYYVNVNTDSALVYAARGMQLTAGMRWDKGVSAFHICYGNIYSTLGWLDSSLNRYQQALTIAARLKDTVNMAVYYNNLGGIANAKSDFVSAATYFADALKLGQLSGNTYSVGLSSENLALIYSNQQDYKKGLAYARQALAAYQSGNHQQMMQSPMRSMAKSFLMLKAYDSSILYYQKALLVCKKNDNKIEEAGILDGFAEYFANREDYTQALAYSLQAKKIWDATGEDYEEAINNTGLTGYYYLQLAKKKPGKETGISELLRSAMRLLQEAVTKNQASGNKNSEATFSNSLSEVYEMTGNYKEALSSYKRYQQIKDSIYSQENKNKIAASIGQFELDKKNDEIAINKLAIANQRKTQVGLVAGLLLLGVIGSLLFWQSLTRKKTNTTLMVLNNQLDDANKVKAKFFAILSHDLRGPVANLISFLQLQKDEPGMLSQQQVAANQQKITSAAESLLETMEAMLLWSKGQMENFTPEIIKVPVSQVFGYLERFFAGTENVQITFSDPGTIELSTDEHYLQTIMHNLTANAIKAVKNTPGASIAWKAVQEGGKTYLSITDNGPGIKEEQAKALYDDGAVANTKYGLGLYLVRDLAKAIHCKIALQTQPGAGTTFTLTT